MCLCLFVYLSAFLSNYKKGGKRRIKAFEKRTHLEDTLKLKTTWGLDQQNKEQMITFTLIALMKPSGPLQELVHLRSFDSSSDRIKAYLLE